MTQKTKVAIFAAIFGATLIVVGIASASPLAAAIVAGIFCLLAAFIAVVPWEEW